VSIFFDKNGLTTKKTGSTTMAEPAKKERRDEELSYM
jgi:hypothetical protein